MGTKKKTAKQRKSEKKERQKVGIIKEVKDDYRDKG